jgi:hypothetical protein
MKSKNKVTEDNNQQAELEERGEEVKTKWSPQSSNWN